MRTKNLPLLGLLLSCLTLLLTGCASTQVVKTETVEVKVPVFVALPSELTNSVLVPYLAAGPATNDAIVDLCERRAVALRLANDQLSKILSLQPVNGGTSP